MSRKRFRTPSALPAETQCRGLSVPASQDWLGVFSNALLETTKAYNYEQLYDTDLTPEATAAAAYAVYTAWLDSECGGAAGACILPDVDTPTFRLNPTSGLWQQLDGGEWVEPFGDYAVPSPAERTEATQAEQECGAASNAMNALKTLYMQTIEFYETEIDPLLNQIELAAEIAVLLGGPFGPFASAWIQLSGFAWMAFQQALADLFVSDWTEEFEQILVCLLKDNLTVTDGVPDFNISGVNADLVGLLLPVVDEYVRVRWQVWYLIQAIGKEGLDVAGGLEAVEGDCVTCDTWCVNLTPEQLGVTVVRGYMNTAGYIVAGAGLEAYGTLTVDTADCVITRVGVTWSLPGGATGAVLVSASPSDGPLYQVWTVGGGNVTTRLSDDNAAWKTNSSSSSLEFYCAGNTAATIYACRVMGTGTNPFGIGSNC